MKKSIIFFIIAGIGLLLNSCDKAEQKTADSDADALFKKIVKTYTLNEDGSVSYQYQHELNLFSYYAFNRLYGETFVVYNPDYQTLKINESVTTTKEGNKVPSPDNAFNEVLPRMASGAPPYSHLREMVITHTGLEKNSTIHLDYQLESKKDFYPFFMGNELLAESSPVKELVIRVQVPEDKKLNYQLFNAKEKLNIAEKAGFTEYEWKFNDLQPISNEPWQPDMGENLPRLIFSTQDIQSALQALQEEIDYILPEGITQSMQNAVKDKNTRLDSILAIQEMVVDHTNHFLVPLNYSGFRLKANETVLEDNGGRTIENTILLTSLLKNIGIDAAPVTVIPEKYYNPEIGNLKLLEKYYVKINHDGKPLYLSAITKNKTNAAYSFADKKHVVLHKSDKNIKTLDVEKNRSSIKLQGNLDLTKANKLMGNIEAEFTYCENPFLDIQRNKSIVNRLMGSAIPASFITKANVDTTTPETTAIHYQIDASLAPVRQGNYFFLDIPKVKPHINGWPFNNLHAERNTVLEMDHRIELTYDYTLSLPEGINWVASNIKLSKENEAGKINIEIVQQAKGVRIFKHLKIEKATITPDHYNDFRILFTEWNKSAHNQLVLKENAE